MKAAANTSRGSRVRIVPLLSRHHRSPSIELPNIQSHPKDFHVCCSSSSFPRPMVEWCRFCELVALIDSFMKVFEEGEPEGGPSKRYIDGRSITVCTSTVCLFEEDFMVAKVELK
mmetsp:Transcript_50957/g.76205  ORF Transcript_50957/g.76205 Transcript_50957/m.76205 type:complete len:115 (-) Transcript_50957:2-346(-)